ncbi:hypothetical protein TSOC_009069 [Tetrabaena socialis]|uniref:Uncharacterized protein n=1 Tax=Tetrabaena socialis TaxID=47790 RepID=A0A2J7ZWU8_9CHLO|nr:hypothetical protein TSOC_009069 [Tetrabaena socialis]|eukprot:PNH04751.1 hypothetical protein TSOC_009069 [Tetrabaena socialis]
MITDPPPLPLLAHALALLPPSASGSSGGNGWPAGPLLQPAPLPPEELRSLQGLCCKVILRHLSVYNCLELLTLSRGMDAPALTAIHAASLRYAVNSFETLQQVRSEPDLRAALPAEVYDSLAAAVAEREAVVAERRAGLGRVREAAAPPEGDAEGRQEPSYRQMLRSLPIAQTPAEVADAIYSCATSKSNEVSVGLPFAAAAQAYKWTGLNASAVPLMS